MQKLEVVNFLRGYSIFTIILMHLVKPSSTGLLKMVLTFGGAGVHVFILVSGFGLYLSYLNRPTSYLPFLRKRFSKVYLPYLLILPLFVAYYYFFLGSFDLTTLSSHVFLFKMFNHTWDTSYAYSLWFISTIFQFYLCWPIILKLAKMKNGLLIAFCLSLLWATAVGLLDKQSDRAWGSFFLQYLWEFVLGMKLAERYHRSPDVIRIPSYSFLSFAVVIGVCLTGMMGKIGGMMKLYNDIPSLLAYLSLALFIYKLSVPFINQFFVHVNAISYEWYLVHGLTFKAFRSMLKTCMPLPLALLSCLMLSYIFALCYSWFITQIGVKRIK